MNFIPPSASDLDLDADRVIDQIKCLYVTCTRAIAKLQYDLAELAGTGKLDPEESMRLQDDLVDFWEEMYCNTLPFVRGEGTYDGTTPDPDDYYSDGRKVCIKAQP